MSALNFELIDIPIEFKEINPSDFNEYYNVSEKIIIKPDDETGYIDDELRPIFEKGFDDKCTVVLNAGVGQGKTYTVINQIADYANHKDYVVIVAVPFNNLIEQYNNDILKKVNSQKVFSFLNIDEVYLDKPPLDKIFLADENNLDKLGKFNVSKYSVHIMTINALLGNPGDSLMQARNKVIFMSKLSKYCETENKKLVIFFDEIHDGIHNFKEEYLYKLWNLKDIVHRIFVISATFNEASKEVIKYLSEFTDKNIQLIESKRKRFPSKQSRLHINFYSGYNIDQDKSLLDLLNSLRKRGVDDFDMMVYSKGLIKKFLENPIGKNKTSLSHFLYPIKDRINRCYYDPFDKINANKKYDSSKINIGTNFSTGVNIEKLNHNYIIILPKEVTVDFFNNKGVFTNGANTIIQALARQRKVGDVYIFMPNPVEISLDSLPYNESQNQIIYNAFNECVYDTTRKVSYSNINAQSGILNKIYDVLYNYVSKATRSIDESQRVGMNRLFYPTKDIFIMDKGEKFLSENFFGGNLSCYIFWASLTNQFLNCRLSSVNSSNFLNLSTHNFENEIKEIFDNEIDFLKSIWNFNSDTVKYLEEFSGDRGIVSYGDEQVEFGHNLSHYELYEYFEKYFFHTYEILLDGKRLDILKKDKVRKEFLLLISQRNNVGKKEFYHLFLKSCIYFSNQLEINSIDDKFISSNELEVINLFKAWYDFVLLLEKLKQPYKGKHVLPNEMPKEFRQLFMSKSMLDNINELRMKDKFLSSDIFPFRNTFGKLKSSAKMADTFYTLLINVLYNGKLKPTTFNKERISRYILEDINFEDSKLINLLHKQLPEVVL